MGDTPWTAEEHDSRLFWEVWTADGMEQIATEISEEQARLIASAPEMAELLEQIFNQAKPRWQLQEDARALLSKIKGQSND